MKKDKIYDIDGINPGNNRVIVFPTDEHFAKWAAEAPSRVKKAVVKLRADLF